MTINRRKALALGLGMMLSFPALASETAPENEVLNALSQAPWIGDGPRSKRYVYVVYAPWCPVCKLLYQRTREGRLDIQLRWVASGSRNDRAINQNLNAVSSRSLGMLARIFLQPDAEIEDLQQNTQALMALALSEATVKTIAPKINLTGYPTLIFVDRKGALQVIAGVPRDLDGVFAQVGAI